MRLEAITLCRRISRGGTRVSRTLLCLLTRLTGGQDNLAGGLLRYSRAWSSAVSAITVLIGIGSYTL